MLNTQFAGRGHKGLHIIRGAEGRKSGGFVEMPGVSLPRLESELGSARGEEATEHPRLINLLA